MNERIEQIWKDYHSRLHGFIQSRVGDPTVADDILQEIFINIFSRIETLKDKNKLESWIYQITRNAIIDYYRSHRKMEQLPEHLAAPAEDLTDKERRESAKCLLPFIDNLPENYREAIMLAEIEGLAQKDVALKQGVSLSGAKSRIQRGRSMVKEMLMECCQFEFDRLGRVIDYEQKDTECGCDDGC